MSAERYRRGFSIQVWLALASATLLVSPCRAGLWDAVSESERLTAVASDSHNGYIRARQPDGSFVPETYAFAEGGMLDSPLMDQFLRSDPTIDNLKFLDLAHMLAGPLSSQNYLPSKDPATTRLLVSVFWGTTIGGGNFSDGNTRDLVNYNNAKLLGFDSEGAVRAMNDVSTVYFGRSFRSRILDEAHSDVLSAVEVNRYFVILRAYDFQEAWRHKRLKILWETRFSLSERRHDFERDVPAMARDASLYFGQDTYGLVMKPIPEGRVEVGEATQVKGEADTEEGSFDPHSGAVGDWRRSTPGLPIIIHISSSGNATFESPGQHVTVPARATTADGAVTVKVPGWGMVIRGAVRGNRIRGTILQYGERNTLTLTRVSGADGN